MLWFLISCPECTKHVEASTGDSWERGGFCWFSSNSKPFLSRSQPSLPYHLCLRQYLSIFRELRGHFQTTDTRCKRWPETGITLRQAGCPSYCNNSGPSYLYTQSSLSRTLRWNTFGKLSTTTLTFQQRRSSFRRILRLELRSSDFWPFFIFVLSTEFGFLLAFFFYFMWLIQKSATH